MVKSKKSEDIKIRKQNKERRRRGILSETREETDLADEN